MGIRNVANEGYNVEFLPSVNVAEYASQNPIVNTRVRTIDLPNELDLLLGL